MQIGIFAKTFAGTDPATVLSAVAAAGFSVTQYNMACSGLLPMPDTISAVDAAKVAAATRRAKVEIAAVSGTFNMIHPDRAVRERGFLRLDVLAGAARALGTRLVTLCTGTRDAEDQWRAHPDNAAPEAWRDLTVAMERAIRIADTYDVDLGIEPELANVISSAEKARRLIDDMASPRLKIVLDPANLFEVETLARQRDIVSAAVECLADRIVLGHAKDRDAAGGFVTAGKGVLDYRHYVGCLRQIGFTGAIVAHGLEAEEAIEVGLFLKGLL